MSRRRPLRTPRLRGRVAAVAAAMALACLTATPASADTVPNGAVATFNSVSRISAAGMGFQSDTGREAGRVSAFESAHPALRRVKAADVLAAPDGALTGRALCHPSNIAGAQGFCWNTTDDATGAWTPQGLTGSGESPQSQTLVGGRKVLISTWYGDGGSERITLVDVTDPAHVTYRHLQLAALNSSGDNYTPILGGHGHGVVWAGSKLYVASTGSSLDVFDLNDIWKMDVTTGTGFGLDAGGKAQGAGHAYVLPRQGTYDYTGQGTGCGAYAGVSQRPCITAASLDLTGAQPALVTAEGDPSKVEGDFGKAAAPVVRWPIDPATGLLKADAAGRVQASEAFASPMGGTQGVAMNNGRLVFAGPCPEFVPAEHQADQSNIRQFQGCLYDARPGEPVRLVTRTAVNPENLSYWPGSDQLWVINEAPGERVVVSTPWPKATPAGMVRLAAADFSGDGKQDLVGVEAGSGKLWLYPGNGVGGLGDRVQIGAGWGAMSELTAADYTGDGKPDLLAVENATGNLYVYPGTGAASGLGTLGDRTQIGSGWGGMRELTALDVNKDGKADLLAIDTAGALWTYPGTGSLNGGNTLGSRVQIGAGWSAMTELTVPGDLDSDGKADLVAIDGAGTLWKYPSTGALNSMNTLGNRAQLGTNWDSMRQLVGADFNGDGKGDLDAVEAPAEATGSLYFYPGNGTGGLGNRAQIGTSW
ncbi:VCBS repeat-containing protein [Streptomyces sp. NBC_00536]|uniref:FG-GAP repeat domain-containing protein n=1 Tax=Streptomyces sp. NBC_00536 TaxID=2975769 RepID=UPI002E81818A|nr:VCBS repeat-containing protein [Streptomyces sp. NBC_00536]WUC80507.1 VCBS repeat-containing protein [Streptomyces sp. NBC_00536]